MTGALMVGPPGCGKTLLAERFADLLPPLSREEALEVARIQSASGRRVDGLPQVRPLRAPSCGASLAGLVGGGQPPRPGEVTLAHRGVLFLDELPQFRPEALESLRQPLESGIVSVSRAASHQTFPARFQLLAAMNPCPCGHGPGSPRCGCTPQAVQRYTRRISGPLLDRIDLRVQVPAVPYAALREGMVGDAGDPDAASRPASRAAAPGRDTASMAADVAAAREVQQRRFGGGPRLNANLTPFETNRWCCVSAAAERHIETASSTGRLSARGISRVQRVARTVADLAGAERIGEEHVLEVLRWRMDV